MVKNQFSLLILKYFRSLAKIQLRKNHLATIIGITGSAGKTSARLALVQILKSRGIVKHSIHANSESGLPLNILGLAPRSYTALDWLRLICMAPLKLLTNWEHFDYYIVEMGIDSPHPPKNMTYLLSIVRPHVGVVLNAGLTHSENFDSLVKDKSPIRRSEKLIALIAREKMHLAKGIVRSGTAVYNLDQKELVKHKKDLVARQLTFGKSPKADVRILSSNVNKSGFTLKFSYLKQTYQLVLPDLYPDHYSYTFASAIASAASLGIPPSISVSALSGYKAPAGRMRIFPGISGSTILDSSYNASPVTMLESLKLLKTIAKNSKKIAVIGDMRELGSSEKLAHKNLSEWLLNYSNHTILYGPKTKEYVLPLLQSKKASVIHFDRMADLITHLRKIIKPNSYILVKGSQNQIYLERAIEPILAHKEDIAKLCRRGFYWDQRRSAAP